MVRVGENEEDILKDNDEELLEKHARCLLIRIRHVVHQLNAHAQASVFDLPIVMFASPHTGIDDEFELSPV